MCMLKKTWYSSITFIIREHTGLHGCDFRSHLTQSTADFPVNSIWTLDICQINSWEIQQSTKVQTMMKMQVADSWETRLRRRFQCNLQSMATCTQQLHLYCCLLQETDCCLFLADDPGDFTDKEIFYIVDCHNVTLLLKSEAGFKLRFIRFWFILYPGSDSSSTCWHLCWQLPWPWRGGSSGNGSPPNSSFSLLTGLSRGSVTINTADDKAALSWPDLAWEVAGRMQQSHPKSWIPHLSGEAAALTVCCPLLPVARKTAFNLENWSSSGEKQQHSFVVSVYLDWGNDLGPTV